MSGPLILAPVPIRSTTDYGTVGAGIGNLQTADPREVWAAGAAQALTFAFDLGPETAIDTVYLGYLDIAQPATITVSGAGGATTAVALPRLAGRPAHALVALPAPIVRSVVEVRINVAAADVPITAGVLMAGLSLRPEWPQELGGGRPVIDTGSRERLKAGGFAIDRGVRKSGWQFVLGDLSDDELATLFSIVLDRGETAPVLVVEDYAPTAGLCERIHYCTFDKLEPYERRDIKLTRWSLTVEDWL